MHIVILPGLDGTGKMLTGFIDALKTQHSVQLITYPANITLSYTELTQSVFDKLPKDKPYVILAESFSGPIAVKLAVQKQLNLKAILFAASFIKKPNAIPKFFGKLATFIPLKLSFLYKLAKPVTFGKWSTKNLENNLYSAIETVSHNVLATRIRNIMAVDELDAFKSIKLPMLYLHPSSDRLVSKSSVREMTEYNSELYIQSIEGSHFILQTNIKGCVDIISEFINARL